MVPLARSASTKRYVVPPTTLVMPTIGSDELDEVMDRSPPEHEVDRALSMVASVPGCMEHEPTVALKSSGA